MMLLPSLAGEGWDGGEPWHKIFPLPNPPPRKRRAREGADLWRCVDTYAFEGRFS
jgi:hypothetical protein